METPPPRGKVFSIAQRIVAVATRKKRGRRSPLIVPEINQEILLGTLASLSLLSTTPGTNPEQDNYLISMDLTVALNLAVSGEGPLVVGVAHEDYSDVEIEEHIEVAAGWSSANMIEQERLRRKIRTIGTFAVQTSNEVLNDGNPIRVKCGWRNGPDDTVKLWVYNRGDGALTTGARVLFNGHAYVRAM